MVSRRTLLLGGGSAAALGGMAVGQDRLPYRVRDALGLADGPQVAVPAGPSGQLVTGRLDSGAAYAVAYPDGTGVSDRLPVCLVLHGRGGQASDAFDSHGLDSFLSEVVRGGTPPFALAAVDGGDHSYWHRRRDGTDPGSIVTALLVTLAERGHPVDRFAVSGWSMGGYGALLLGARLGPQRVAVVVANSPALFPRFSDARPGAFDDEADHRANDLFRLTDQLRQLPVRLTCGTDDPFEKATRALAKELPTATTAFGPGAHDVAFWRSTAAADLRFIGRALT